MPKKKFAQLFKEADPWTIFSRARKIRPGPAQIERSGPTVHRPESIPSLRLCCYATATPLDYPTRRKTGHPLAAFPPITPRRQPFSGRNCAREVLGSGPLLVSSVSALCYFALQDHSCETWCCLVISSQQSCWVGLGVLH